MTDELVNKEAVRMDLYADTLQTYKLGSQLALVAYLNGKQWYWEVNQLELWGLSNQKRIDLCVDGFRDKFKMLGIE